MTAELNPIYVVSAVTAAITILILAYLMHSLFSFKKQMIIAGLDDEEILADSQKEKSKLEVVSDVFSVAFTIVLLIVTAISVYARANNNYFAFPKVGSLNVVASGSMSYQNKSNQYLVDNNLDNQIEIYDVIAVSPVSEPEEIKLYDIVVYKNNEKYTVHRIIDIHQGEDKTLYTLRGDANPRSDAKPITFDEIIGKYDGVRIPLLGVFVVFLQSTQGYIAVGLVVLMTIYTMILEKKLKKVIRERLEAISETVVLV